MQKYSSSRVFACSKKIEEAKRESLLRTTTVGAFLVRFFEPIRDALLMEETYTARLERDTGIGKDRFKTNRALDSRFDDFGCFRSVVLFVVDIPSLSEIFPFRNQYDS